SATPSPSSTSSAGGVDAAAGKFMSTVQAARQNSFGPTSPAEKPYMSATAPWAGGGDEFSGFSYGGSGGGGAGGGYDYDAGSRGGGRQGLPNNSGGGRRGPGLPSGPRGTR
ncbi:hypothetical protein B7463_g6589, partial [Scytalidium lignicola]